jgi:tetratricopeptide (TPR) repeat protein
LKRSFVFSTLLLFSLFVCVANAATYKDEWISVKSKNFHLIGNASEKEIRQVATKLEQFRETFRLLFPGLKVDSPIKTTVIVFKNDSAYRPFKPRRPDGKPDDGIAGYFQAGEDVNYITLSTEGESAQTFGTIFHEYTHFMLETSIGKANIPPWFNEGLAEYYQTYQIVDDQKVTLGIVQNQHLDLLQQAKLIPFKQFFEVDNYSLHANGHDARSVFYAQAWALIHYLIQGNGGNNVKALQTFLSLVLKETPPETAFKQAFNSDYAKMETDLRAYIGKNKYTATLFTLKEKLVFDPQMTVQPVSDENANAYLGDLLYHIRAYDAAEAQLKKTLDVVPDHSFANTAMGMVKLRQRNFPEAKKFLERAIAGDQKSYLAQYNYAFVISRESVDEFGYIQRFPPDAVTKMRTALNKAIEFDPTHAESYRLMAFINFVNGEDLGEALKYVDRALAIQPGDPDFMILSAKILLRQEKFEAARNAAERVAKSTDDKDVKADADQLIGTIKQIEDSKARYERQLADAKAAFDAQARQLNVSNSKPPVILKRKDLTDEQMEKIERDREVANINRLIGSPLAGEKRVLGRIDSITCPKGDVRIKVTTPSGPLTLSAASFQALSLVVYKEGTQNFEIGCGADLSAESVVITYKSPEKQISGVNGEMLAGAFVPSYFRFMTGEELASMPLIVVEGGTPTDLASNAKKIEEENTDFEKKRKEFMLRQIQQSLREPLAGETRTIGTVDSIECSGSTMWANVTTAAGGVRLRIASPNELKLVMFTQDTTALRFGCGESFSTMKAVVTYLPSADKKKFAGDLKALEFVPPSFSLP